jgi:ABC-type transporter Mla maintaining outer membrane lipid asymmetry ATPase subunit MlaF
MKTALVQCRDLVVGYDDKVILENVNLEIYPGEIVALLGASGGGKSTVMRTIIGLQPPISGEVLLFGEPLTPIMGAGLLLIIGGVLCIELGRQRAEKIREARLRKSGEAH